MKRLMLALFILPLQAIPPKIIITKAMQFKAATAAAFINHVYQVNKAIKKAKK